MPVGAQRRSMVDDRAILQRDDGIGAHARPVAVCPAGFRHDILCVRYVRSWAAESRSAGHDAVRVLVAAARAAVDRGKHVRAGHRDQGFPGGGVSVSGMATAVVVARKHGCVSRGFTVCRSGARARIRAQHFRTKDLVSGHGGIQFGAGVWTARRAELVLGQSIHHRGHASADAAGQLQPG